MKKVAILGSTGSIGESTLDVIRDNRDKFEVSALAAGSNYRLLAKQIEEFQPKLSALFNGDSAKNFRDEFPSFSLEEGVEGMLKAAAFAESDVVVSAIVGAAGLMPTFAAVDAGKDIALANKETLVMAGRLFWERMSSKQRLLPVDSEHSAIFQALRGENPKEVKKIILTASGGPFRQTSAEDLKNVTKAMALKHPSWSMGEKISIDSATMMNKGLEVIEARWLFDVKPEQIEVVVHPESIIHSMVEFVDGSVIAQLSMPDMRLPIAYALTYPQRIPLKHKELNLAELGSLNFEKPDPERFPCLRLAFEAMKGKDSCPIVLNAANEIVVQAFLEERIGFQDIPQLIEKVLNSHEEKNVSDIQEVVELDSWARNEAKKNL